MSILCQPTLTTYGLCTRFFGTNISPNVLQLLIYLGNCNSQEIINFLPSFFLKTSSQYLLPISPPIELYMYFNNSPTSAWNWTSRLPFLWSSQKIKTLMYSDLLDQTWKTYWKCYPHQSRAKLYMRIKFYWSHAPVEEIEYCDANCQGYLVFNTCSIHSQVPSASKFSIWKQSCTSAHQNQEATIAIFLSSTGCQRCSKNKIIFVGRVWISLFWELLTQLEKFQWTKTSQSIY